MGNPANPTEQMPHGDDYLVRRLDNLQRQINELGPSIANSFNTTVARLVQPVVAHGEAHGFALPYSDDTVTPVIPMTTLVTVNITVPAGYSRALVLATSELSCYNGSPGPGSMYLETLVAGQSSTTGNAMSSSASRFWYAFMSKTNTKVLTGLSGSFNITVMGGADSTWPANTYNLVNLNASVLFLP